MIADVTGSACWLVIVTGPPGSGKSTLARRLATDLGLPRITKDGIKEALADELEAVDHSTSILLGRASWAALWHVLKVELAARRTVLVEGNFTAAHADARLAQLTQSYDFSVFQIHCFAPPDVLYRRCTERVAERHHAHADAERFAGVELSDLEEAFNPDRYRLDVGGESLSLDTSSPAGLQYESVLDAVHAQLLKA